jgi:hypothetical protein
LGEAASSIRLASIGDQVRRCVSSPVTPRTHSIQRRLAWLLVLAVLPLTPTPALAEPVAQPSGDQGMQAGPDGRGTISQEALAASSQNRVANLISVPFQTNTTFGLSRPGTMRP